MREILFRGKRKDTREWVYGSIICTSLKKFFIYRNYKKCEVIPETVGQYTGLTDKNNNKIFENDILEGDFEDYLDPGAKWRSIVVWGTFGWMCKGRQCIPMDEFDILEGEVIGNIFDNSLEE